MSNLVQDSPLGRERSRALPLAGLTAMVMLAHWALLTGTPWATASVPQPSTPTVSPLHFTSRTIRPEVASPDITPAPASPLQQVHAASRPPKFAPSSANVINAGAPLPPTETEEQPPINGPLEKPLSAENKPSTDEDPTETPHETHVELAANPAVPERPAPSPSEAIALKYTVPAPARLKYDIKGEVKGFPYFANGELLWVQDGTSYQARLEISHFLLGSRVQTSKGQLTPQGLEPLRFGDKVRSEVAAHFERSKNKVSFSANTPDAPLLPGAQDQLSVFIQLASLLGGNPSRFAPGAAVTFQAVGPRSSETWLFTVGATESQTLPGGIIKATKLTREPVGEFDPRVEVWLAPSLDYLPVRIRLAQSNGDFVEQQWHSTQKP